MYNPSVSLRADSSPYTGEPIWKVIIMKIVIRGYSGSGKSTLARRLAEQYGIPVLHLDRVHWTQNWTERDDAEKRQIVRDFLDGNDSWVIDGNYSSLYQERRLEEADQILLLLFDRFTCLHRVLRRYRRYKGKTRPDMGEGCEERVDAAFLRWVLWEGRSRKIRQNYAQIAAQYSEKTVILRNQRELDAWMRRLDKDENCMIS